MATVTQKTINTFKIAGHCLSHTRCDIEVRDVDTTTDEPESRGGTNMGLSPVETQMAALLGCTNVITHKLAQKHGVEIRDMGVEAEVTFDRRGTQLMEEIDIPFPKITLNIEMTTDADDAAVAKVKDELKRFCPIAKVLRQAGTQIEENWEIHRP